MTLLASIPTFSLNLRSSISRNLTEIVQLHEELLGDLHRVVPHSEYSQPEHTRIRVAPLKPGHQRWRSLDAVPEHKGDLSWLQKIPGLTSDSAIAAEVAKVFGKKVFWSLSSSPQRACIADYGCRCIVSLPMRSMVRNTR